LILNEESFELIPHLILHLPHISYQEGKAACPFTLCRGFFTPKIVGTFYLQGYKVKEKTAIVPHSVALYPQFQNSVGTLGRCQSPGEEYIL
jgi:hypothetical protein